MGRLTTNRQDPGLGHGGDDELVAQNEAYLVMDAVKGERVRPFRASYRHGVCGTVTTIYSPIAETYARNPGFYALAYCVNCRKHLPVAEFTWTYDGQVLGS